MIRRFRHKGLERFFLDGDTRGVDARFANKLARQLLLLNRSRTAEGMNVPGWRLHALKGDRKGQFAVSVSGNWRLLFAFEDEDVVDVDLADYH